jgi:hypothetical protein
MIDNQGSYKFLWVVSKPTKYVILEITTTKHMFSKITPTNTCSQDHPLYGPTQSIIILTACHVR